MLKVTTSGRPAHTFDVELVDWLHFAAAPPITSPPALSDIDVNSLKLIANAPGYALKANAYPVLTPPVQAANVADVALACTFHVWQSSPDQNRINKMHGRGWSRLTGKQ